jgi:hypothetical protein
MHGVQEATALRGRGIDALLEHLEVGAALAELSGQLEQMPQRAHRAGQPGDHQGVAGPQP